MSAKAREAEEHSLSPLPGSGLTPAEKKRLNFLGYKANDIAELSTDDARRLIEAKQRKAGSKAFLHTAVNPLTGTPGSPLPVAFSNEEIMKRNTGKEQAFIVQDEWAGKGLRAGGLLFDELDRPYRDENPGLVFRWLHEEIVKKLGTDGFQEVRGPDGKRVLCADHWLAFKPRAVQENQDRALAEEVNAPFKDIGEAQTANLKGVVGDRAVVTQESTIHRGDERPRYVTGA